MQVSHPSRVRELKLVISPVSRALNTSHPSRVRELKRRANRQVTHYYYVAPLPGA
ncbi:hypothetical protein HMPREF3185_02147 [Porphyromonas somerae]|uniref:Uncharacterized protein n=1 Tax=Porphyromonas somerae TaxID=322095 RepID=A0A134AZL7_9PORP|nr:hypothetical protein HMPREF3184_02147 [Porphyromonadaceae bacterium KA00676]KXB73122.1 hypothetical protein HMPREF3185_02147 [Porphyromonas somerae]